MRQPRHLRFRQQVIGGAEGRVLEIGVGSGLNLPLYGAAVSAVIGLEPSSELLAMARSRAATASVPITLLDGSAEAIPLDSHSIDTVVTTWTMCTIPDVAKALGEVRRVLKPGGGLLFVEHGRAPDRRSYFGKRLSHPHARECVAAGAENSPVFVPGSRRAGMSAIVAGRL